MAVEKINIGVAIPGQAAPGWNNSAPSKLKDLTAPRGVQPKDYRRDVSEQFPPVAPPAPVPDPPAPVSDPPV